MNTPLYFPAVIAASFVGLLIGLIWYNPKVFGTMWKKEIGMSPDYKPDGKTMAITFGLTWLMCFFLSVAMASMVIHQMGVYSLLTTTHDQVQIDLYQSIMDAYHSNFRSYRHGALHGAISAITVAMPILVVGALFERRSWKYIFITVGYWLVTMIIMGAIICHFQP